MFIVGVLFGPALAIISADFLLKSGGLAIRWAILAVGVLMIAIAVVPFFSAGLKAGLLIGFPLGLLLTATPMVPLPFEPADDHAR